MGGGYISPRHQQVRHPFGDQATVRDAVILARSQLMDIGSLARGTVYVNFEHAVGDVVWGFSIRKYVFPVQ